MGGAVERRAGNGITLGAAGEGGSSRSDGTPSSVGRSVGSSAGSTSPSPPHATQVTRTCAICSPVPAHIQPVPWHPSHGTRAGSGSSTPSSSASAAPVRYSSPIGVSPQVAAMRSIRTPTRSALSTRART